MPNKQRLDQLVPESPTSRTSCQEYEPSRLLMGCPGHSIGLLLCGPGVCTVDESSPQHVMQPQPAFQALQLQKATPDLQDVSAGSPSGVITITVVRRGSLATGYAWANANRTDRVISGFCQAFVQARIESGTWRGNLRAAFWTRMTRSGLRRSSLHDCLHDLSDIAVCRSRT